jgi:hypothetical protein
MARWWFSSDNNGPYAWPDNTDSNPENGWGGGVSKKQVVQVSRRGRVFPMNSIFWSFRIKIGSAMPDPELLVKDMEAMKLRRGESIYPKINKNGPWPVDDDTNPYVDTWTNHHDSPFSMCLEHLRDVLRYTDEMVSKSHCIMEFFMIHKALRLCLLRAISWLIDNGEDTEFTLGLNRPCLSNVLEKLITDRESDEYIPNLYYGETHDSEFQCLKEHVLTMLRMGPLSRAVYNLETEKVLRMLMGEKRCFRVALGKDSEKNGVPECLKKLGPQRTIMSFLERNIYVNDRGISERGPTAVKVAQDKGYEALALYLRTRWGGKAYGYYEAYTGKTDESEDEDEPWQDWQDWIDD